MFKRLDVYHGFGVSIFRVHFTIYTIGISYYVPWKWFPTLQLGQMESERHYIFQVKRISNTHIQGFLFHWLYFIMRWPGRFKWEKALAEHLQITSPDA